MSDAPKPAVEKKIIIFFPAAAGVLLALGGCGFCGKKPAAAPPPPAPVAEAPPPAPAPVALNLSKAQGDVQVRHVLADHKLRAITRVEFHSLGELVRRQHFGIDTRLGDIPDFELLAETRFHLRYLRDISGGSGFRRSSR